MAGKLWKVASKSGSLFVQIAGEAKPLCFRHVLVLLLLFLTSITIMLVIRVAVIVVFNGSSTSTNSFSRFTDR